MLWQLSNLEQHHQDRSLHHLHHHRLLLEALITTLITISITFSYNIENDTIIITTPRNNKYVIKSQNQNLTLELEKNPDILEFVGTAPNRPALVIGFCAESENLLEYAQEKLLKKNCDLIVANDIENGKIFGSDFTSAYFVEKNHHSNLFKGTKTQLAQNLADIIAKK